MDVAGLEYPGHGDRAGEVCVTDPLALAAECAAAVHASQHARPIPYALFGHSFGALLAFEATRTLRRVHRDRPILLPPVPTHHRTHPRCGNRSHGPSCKASAPRAERSGRTRIST